MNTQQIARNRKIKADRIYRTLGKMSWYRIVAGILLLCFAAALAGLPSEYFLGKENYKAAASCVISKKWMNSNRPEVMKLINAGKCCADGECEAAAAILDTVVQEEVLNRNLIAYKTLCTTVGDALKARGEDVRAEEMYLLASYEPPEKTE